MTARQKVVFLVRGLHCASCAIDVGRALRKIPGVLEANVNYVVDKGFVEFDPDRTSWDALEKVLSVRGYAVMRTH